MASVMQGCPWTDIDIFAGGVKEGDERSMVLGSALARLRQGVDEFLRCGSGVEGAALTGHLMEHGYSL